MISAADHAGQVELHGERLGEQPRIALRDAGAAAFAHADLDDAERLERAQRVARDDAAGAEAGGEVLLGAEEVAGLELLGEERVAHPGDDLRRQRGGAAGKHDAGGELAAHHHRLPQCRPWHVRALIESRQYGVRFKIVKILSLAAQLKIADGAERFELRCIAPARAASKNIAKVANGPGGCLSGVGA